jgi:hypothetical protein
VILRPVGERYVLVANGWMRGYMNGEALEGFKAGTESLEDFIIVRRLTTLTTQLPNHFHVSFPTASSDVDPFPPKR